MTRYVQRFENLADPRLGRHVCHDSRSRSFPFPASNLSMLTATRHLSHIPTLNQGFLGSCTADAAIKCLSYDPFWSEAEANQVLTDDADADHQYAVGVYSDSTSVGSFIGSYPPVDTGSDGLSVAKVLAMRGLISGYLHAFSFEALLSALAQQPVSVGTQWRRSMFDPGSDGQLSVTGPMAGGHQYCLDELDMERRRVWLQNSWGDAWGLHGRAWLSWDDMRKLLAEHGDCTVFVPLSDPAPVASPVVA